MDKRALSSRQWQWWDRDEWQCRRSTVQSSPLFHLAESFPVWHTSSIQAITYYNHADRVVVLLLLLLRCAGHGWHHSAKRGWADIILAVSLSPPFLSLSFSTASLLWLVISAKSPPLVRSFVHRPDGLPVSAHWLHSFLPSHLIYAEIYKYQRYPFYPQREKLLDGKLNGSARKKLRLRRDFNVIHECARIALILERRGNDKAHLPLVFHVIKYYGWEPLQALHL